MQVYHITIVRSKSTCPIHVLGHYLSSLDRGTQPFVHMRPPQIQLALRELLAEIGVDQAHMYRTHDLRRGHADDIRKSGGRLADILQAGDWSSGAFATYLDQHMLERDGVAEAHNCRAEFSSDSSDCASEFSD